MAKRIRWNPLYVFKVVHKHSIILPSDSKIMLRTNKRPKQPFSAQFDCQKFIILMRLFLVNLRMACRSMCCMSQPHTRNTQYTYQHCPWRFLMSPEHSKWSAWCNTQITAQRVLCVKRKGETLFCSVTFDEMCVIRIWLITKSCEQDVCKPLLCCLVSSVTSDAF